MVATYFVTRVPECRGQGVYGPRLTAPYRGIWALIQATISQIDFDYASYAKVRLDEYYAWRDSVASEREQRWNAE